MRPLLLVLALAALLAAPALGAGKAHAGLQCRSGYVDGVVGGEHKCLHTGEFCSAAHQADYARYGFACVDGHLRAGKAQPTKTGHRTAAPSRTTLLARRTRTSGCRVHGPLPDRRCSPGAIYADAPSR